MLKRLLAIIIAGVLLGSVAGVTAYGMVSILSQAETFHAVVTVWYPVEVQERIAQQLLESQGRTRDPATNVFVRAESSAISCGELFDEFGYPVDPKFVGNFPDDVLRHFCLVNLPLR